MLTYQPAISNLKTIRTDIEKAKQFSLLNQRFKAAAIRFPSSTERQKKANGTQIQWW